jgi:hypothetical protein
VDAITSEDQVAPEWQRYIEINAAHYRELLGELERGEVRDVVFAVPADTAWALPLYELALLTAAWLIDRRVAGARLTLVTPEQAPLAAFGGRASDTVAELLDQQGVALRCAVVPRAVGDRALVLGDDLTLACERVVALARPAGPALPADTAGFVPVDEHGRVSGVQDVYAAGDVTTWPMKQAAWRPSRPMRVAESLAAWAGAARGIACPRPARRPDRGDRRAQPRSWPAAGDRCHSAGGCRQTFDVDLAAGAVGIVGDEARERGGGSEPVEQAAGEAAVQRADDVLVLAHGVAVRAVAQPAAQPSLRPRVELGLKPQRREHVADRLLGRRRSSRGEFLADLAAGGLDLAQARGRRGNRAGEPASERAIGVRRVAAGPGGRGDRPFVARAAARPRDAAVNHQAGIAHPVQVRAHAVGMQGEPLGELVGGGRPAEVAKERKQPPPRRLGEHVVVPVYVGEVNSSQFSHLTVGNRWGMVRCRRSSGESGVR